MNENIFEGTMANMAWPEIEKLAKCDALVILPIGVIEEHGVHLPLGTDIYLAISQARNIASGMRAKNEPCVIVPPYYWGTIESVTKNFPGSFTAKPEHIKAMITDILESVERAGFKRLITTNAHGDGLHIRTIITALKEYNQTHCMNARWLAFENDVKMYGIGENEDFILSIDSNKFTDRITGVENLKDDFDVHAGAVETAYMKKEYPQLTNLEIAKLQSPTMLKGEQINQWMSGKPEHNGLTPAGHVGDPCMSNQLQSKVGEQYIEMAELIVAFYKGTNELIQNIEKLHTTEMGIERIKRNLSLEATDVVEWCRLKIMDSSAVIERKGKNWYVDIEDCEITVNAYSYTIITAHRQ